MWRQSQLTRAFCVDFIIEHCLAPKKVGWCRGSFPRWFYNPTLQQCEEFIFGGCKPNKNNYLREEECQLACKNVRGKSSSEISSLFPIGSGWLRRQVLQLPGWQLVRAQRAEETWLIMNGVTADVSDPAPGALLLWSVSLVYLWLQKYSPDLHVTSET